MKLIKNDAAVNEIIGTIIMLIVATSVFSAVFAVVMSAPTPPSDIFVNLEASIRGENITITHIGGEALSLDTKITFKIDNNKENYTVNDLLDIILHENGWNIGEQIIFQSSILENNNIVHTIHIQVVDKEINTLLMDVELKS
jgi:hypothetical protein